LDKHIRHAVGANQHEQYTLIFDKQTVSGHYTYAFYVAADATIKIDVLIAHADVQINLECFLQGAGASATIRGIYNLSGTCNSAVKVLQHHQAAHTSSSVVIKGVLSDMAQAHYHGTISIDKAAHSVNASQENKNILLTDRARVVSIPNLQVLNNEVKCFHGSAIGSIDAQQLLYAASRGIDEAVAKKLLLRAFLADVFNNNELHKKMELLIG